MTLYDLLGALPNDDAEGLRTAFRRAVKGAHPDIHPGDPEAAWKFRRIVRAQEILGDAEQRAAYDHLLDLARLEEESASGHATAARVHKLASGVIALTGASIMTVGGYLLFTHMSEASIAPAEKAAMHASVSVGPAPAAPGKSASLVEDESSAMAGEAVASSAGIPTNAENIPPANVGPVPGLAASDARPSRARGASVSRNGHLNGGIADPNRATRLDPNFSPTAIDRGINFYRLQKFERAFADIAPTKPIEKPVRSKSASTATSTPRLDPAATARPPMPLPRRRPVMQDPSREEGEASMRQR